MWGRLFRRSRQPTDGSTCARCGRTLLAGEWTQRQVADDGSELLMCALCVRADAAPGDDPGLPDAAPTSERRSKSSRADSDAFWRAL